MKNQNKITFKDLSFWLKTAVVSSLVVGSIYAFTFLVTFIAEIIYYGY